MFSLQKHDLGQVSVPIQFHRNINSPLCRGHIYWSQEFLLLTLTGGESALTSRGPEIEYIGHILTHT